MKLLLVLLCALATCFTGNGWARPVDLSAPSAQVGSAGLNGDLQLWTEVDGVGLDMGKGSYLPLRFKFSSAPGTTGMMGPGFYCPMFEARNILIREQMMRAFLPCGKGLYLRRNTADPKQFQTVDGEWKGLLDGDDFSIARDDGWKVSYHQGRLASIDTDDHHTFEWSYNDQGIATGVSRDGQTMIAVETDINGKLSGFSFGGKRYTIDFADRPSMEVVNGQTLVGKMISAMSAFHYPDGRTATYKVLLAPTSLVPTLDFIDTDKNETFYTWDAANGHIASEKGPDGNWTYKVADVTEPFGVPAITRTNEKNQTEGMALDNKTGTYTATNLDGSTTVTHTFKTPGPLFGKVHKVEKIVNGQTSTIYQASYDEMGRLVRKVDEHNIITALEYDQGGQLVHQAVRLSDAPEVRAKLALEEKALLKRYSEGKLNSRTHLLVLNDLILFYVTKELDMGKAAALMPMIKDRDQEFNLKLFLAICDPNNTTSSRNYKLDRLETEFPDKKTYIASFKI